jgi:hypothetical protein
VRAAATIQSRAARPPLPSHPQRGSGSCVHKISQHAQLFREHASCDRRNGRTHLRRGRGWRCIHVAAPSAHTEKALRRTRCTPFQAAPAAKVWGNYHPEATAITCLIVPNAHSTTMRALPDLQELHPTCPLVGSPQWNRLGPILPRRGLFLVQRCASVSRRDHIIGVRSTNGGGSPYRRSFGIRQGASRLPAMEESWT